VAHNTDKVGFPNHPIRSGMRIVLEARDPTTDAQVGGVTASQWSIFGTLVTSGALEDTVPLYSPEDVGGSPTV
jgi:hypothetical protein